MFNRLGITFEPVPVEKEQLIARQIRAMDDIHWSDVRAREEAAGKIDIPGGAVMIYSDEITSVERARIHYQESLDSLNMLGGDERGGTMGTHCQNMLNLLI